MYHLAAVHFIANRQTDNSIMPIEDHNAYSSKIGWNATDRPRWQFIDVLTRSALLSVLLLISDCGKL